MTYKEFKKLATELPSGYENFNDTAFALNTNKINDTIDSEIRKHYAKLLAMAYFKSTGKKLSDPDKSIHPVWGYALGRAANIDPAIMKQLSPYYAQKLGGHTSKMVNASPELVEDAVHSLNLGRRWIPYEQSKMSEGKMSVSGLPPGRDITLGLSKG